MATIWGDGDEQPDLAIPHCTDILKYNVISNKC